MAGDDNRITQDPHLSTLTLSQISQQYAVSERTLRRYLKQGRLKATKVGRSYQVTLAELQRFLNS